MLHTRACETLGRAERNGSRRQIRCERKQARDWINMQLSIATLKEWRTGTLVVSYEGLRRSELMHLPHLSLTSFEDGEAARSESCDTNLEPTNQLCSACSTILLCNCLVPRNSKAQWRGGEEAHSHSYPFTSLLSVLSVPSLLYTQSKFTQAGDNTNPHSHKYSPDVAADISYVIHNDKSILTACVKVTCPSHTHFEQMTNKVRKNKSATIPELNEAQHVDNRTKPKVAEESILLQLHTLTWISILKCLNRY